MQTVQHSLTLRQPAAIHRSLSTHILGAKTVRMLHQNAVGSTSGQVSYQVITTWVGDYGQADHFTI